MAVVAMPAWPVPADIDWSIDVPAQANRSEFTRKRRVTLLPEAPRWRAIVRLPPILGEPAAEAWRAFVVDLDGIANSFDLIACERDQITGVTPRVNGAGQQGFSLVTDGWGAAGMKLRRGQFVRINGQLLMLMAPVLADSGGNASLFFKPWLREAPADNAPIVVTRPSTPMSMVDPKNGWKVGIGQNYAISFECEEP